MSVYWLLPERARKLHAFIDGQGISVCRWHHADSYEPRYHNVTECCVRCRRGLAS